MPADIFNQMTVFKGGQKQNTRSRTGQGGMNTTKSTTVRGKEGTGGKKTSMTTMHNGTVAPCPRVDNSTQLGEDNTGSSPGEEEDEPSLSDIINGGNMVSVRSVVL